jgi:hypothetical protein
MLVKAVEVARGSHVAAQKKAIDGADVWKRMIDELEEPVEEISDEEMDIDD